MQSIVMPLTEELSNENKKQLTSEVKETLAVDANTAKTKFTAVDMWNRQRQSRSASDMIRRWNLN